MQAEFMVYHVEYALHQVNREQLENAIEALISEQWSTANDILNRGRAKDSLKEDIEYDNE